MRLAFWLTAVLILALSGCRLQEREKELDRRTQELDQKEQQLVLREQQLSLKEADLTRREKALTAPVDSTGDSTVVYNPYLVGRWSVQMRCTETSCEGSAVGDTKTEQWAINYRDNRVFAQAVANNELFRVYTGSYKQDALVLTAQQDSLAPNTRITVSLRFKTSSTMEGQREIVREGVCRIVYALELTKL
ncbi:hypothetical protein DYU11_04470 [Fibrisoma montanum]|uniref:Uncharacterized protein n=1 Tax=Fibrisoma montanum TaxID=2305895 RepID=A0A418MJ93_9BACT|nr:hypothetical protein [Fibrisoma montanum]RIV27565.1 hypothetical protein DYU11_04470 [Fibrisoma montanum]